MALSGTALRCERARSWMHRAKALPKSDLDARFIFAWIALNALYGQAKYRQRDGEKSSEQKDIADFVKCMVRLDDAAIRRALRDPSVRQRSNILLRKSFLYDPCWGKWDANRIVGRAERQSCCVPPSTPNDLVAVFHRLYVLRKQIFHGCSTDNEPINRPSLTAAVPVLEKMVDTFIGIVHHRGGGVALLKDPPYPPSEANDDDGEE